MAVKTPVIVIAVKTSGAEFTTVIILGAPGEMLVLKWCLQFSCRMLRGAFKPVTTAIRPSGGDPMSNDQRAMTRTSRQLG